MSIKCKVIYSKALTSDFIYVSIKNTIQRFSDYCLLSVKKLLKRLIGYNIEKKSSENSPSLVDCQF